MRTITKESIIPVIPVYSGNDDISFGTSGDIITTNSGVSLYLSDISSKYADIKTNRNTMVQLVSKANIGEILTDVEKPNTIVSNAIIYACSGTNGINKVAVAISESPGFYFTSNLSDENISYFTIVNNEDDTYSFIYASSIIESIAVAPSAITCVNAGTVGANLTYTMTNSISGTYPIYTNGSYSIKFVPSASYWGIYQNSSLLYKNVLSRTYIPPEYNWTTESGGTNPPPYLTYSFPTNGKIMPVLRKNWISEISEDYQKFTLSAQSNGWYKLMDISGNQFFIQNNGVNYEYFAFSEDGTELIDIAPISMNGLSKTNNYVQYENLYKPDYSSESAILEPDSIISGVPLNYVLTSPYYNIEVSGDVAYLPTDIMPLKNFKTINSDQVILSANSVDLRDYNRVYLGGNQLAGYPEIHLGYSTNYGIILNFVPNTYTYFHMPLIAETQYLSAANLEKSGAVAGRVPAYSDRIFKKKADYSDYIWWGGDADEVNNGTWLCAWLSASENPTWMERYYNPGTISYATAMETTATISNDFVPNTPEVRDVISNMKLSPGSYYKYFHVGAQELESALDTTYGIKNENVIVKYSKFDTNSIIVDDANHSDAILLNPDVATIFPLEITSDATNLDAIFLNSSTIKSNPSEYFQISSDKTTFCWIYMDDWKNTGKKNSSCSIHSNYFDGGDKLEYIDHGLYYSCIVPYYSTGSQYKVSIINAQPELDFITSGAIPTALSAVSLAVDLDGYLWCAGNVSSSSNTQLYKMTPNGTVFKNIELNFPISKFMILNDNIGYAVSGTNYYPINLHTLEFSGNVISTSNGLYSYITSGSNGAVLSTANYYTDIFEDLTLVQNKQTYITINGATATPPSACSVTHVCCDSNSTVFASTKLNSNGKYYLHEIDRETKIWTEIDGNIPSGAYGTPLVFLTKETLNTIKQDILYWMVPTTGKMMIYKYYKNATTHTYEKITGSELELPLQYALTIHNSDFSGYILNKVYSAMRNQNPVLKYSMITNTSTDIVKTSTEIDVSEVSNNWHHISTSKNDNVLSLYIDGVVQSETPIVGDILTSPEAAYCIGSDIIKSNAFNDIFGDKTGLFNGAISEFVAIKNGLSDLSIFTFYIHYFIDDTAMEWNVKTSNRQFIENIKTAYKFKIPGIKSQFYDVIIRDSGISIEDKSAYETAIRNKAKLTMPDYVKLRNIIWK